MPPTLKWVPLPLDGNLKSLGIREAGSIQPPAGLEDFQVGWYWNLFWTALRNTDHPGFLASRKNLWTFAGAHRRAHWDANCALVMAAFELREISGQKLWCLPPLRAIVEEQMKKLGKDKKKGGDSSGGDMHNIHSVPQTVGDLSPPLQSGFDFDFDSKKGSEFRVSSLEPKNSSELRAVSSELKTHDSKLITHGYTQADFDARDLRKMAKAWQEVNECTPEGRRLARFREMSNRQMFEYVCAAAGVTIARGLELEERRKKWPEKVPDWLREESG